jgi:hypothetical protein
MSLKHEFSVDHPRPGDRYERNSSQYGGAIARLFGGDPIFEQGRFWLPASLHVTNHEGEIKDLVLVHDFIEEEYAAFPWDCTTIVGLGWCAIWSDCETGSGWDFASDRLRAQLRIHPIGQKPTIAVTFVFRPERSFTSTAVISQFTDFWETGHIERLPGKREKNNRHKKRVIVLVAP